MIKWHSAAAYVGKWACPFGRAETPLVSTFEHAQLNQASVFLEKGISRAIGTAICRWAWQLHSTSPRIWFLRILYSLGKVRNLSIFVYPYISHTKFSLIFPGNASSNINLLLLQKIRLLFRIFSIIVSCFGISGEIWGHWRQERGLLISPENRFSNLTEQCRGMKQPDVLFWQLI